MLTVYMMFVGMPVYAALACHCVKMSAEEHVEACYTHRVQVTEKSASSSYSVPCCDDEHANSDALYIPSSSDNNDLSRHLILDAVFLPGCGADVCVARECAEGCGQEAVDDVRPCCVAASGVRGPPQM